MRQGVNWSFEWFFRGIESSHGFVELARRSIRRMILE